MSLVFILFCLLIASHLHVLVDRLCVVLLLFVMLIYDLPGSLDGAEGVMVHRVGLLERTSDFHIDFVVVGKELLRKCFLLR